MTKGKFCSIILPNYNHSAFLHQRIKSILNQTFQDFELILLDDASTDESQEILKHFENHPKVSYLILNRENSGSPFKQWLKGIRLAKGEFIWIAESDDFSEPLFLERIIQYFELYPKMGLVYSQSIDIDENGEYLHNRINWTAEFQPNIWQGNFVLPGAIFIERYLKVKNVIPNASAVVFKRSLVKEVFFEDSGDMKMCGDWLFWIRLGLNSNIGFISQPLNYFRGHIGSSRNHKSKLTKANRLLEESKVRRIMITYINPDQDVEIRRLYKQWINLHTFYDLMNQKFYSILIRKSDWFLFFKLLVKAKFYAR